MPHLALDSPVPSRFWTPSARECRLGGNRCFMLCLRAKSTTCMCFQALPVMYLCLLKTVFIYHLTRLCFELTLVVLKPFAQASSAVLAHASLYFCALLFVVLSCSFCFPHPPGFGLVCTYSGPLYFGSFTTTAGKRMSRALCADSCRCKWLGD